MGERGELPKRSSEAACTDLLLAVLLSSAKQLLFLPSAETATAAEESSSKVYEVRSGEAALLYTLEPRTTAPLCGERMERGSANCR